MYIMDDGIRLNAALELPAGNPEKCPLVIVIHGFTGHMEEPHILAVSQAIRDAGFATLRVEMYGHGNSGGTFAGHTLYKWLTNALTVIDYARGLEFVTDLYLCGHSQGGLTVMLAGAMKREQISGLIPMSPACSIPGDTRQGRFLGESFDPNCIPETLSPWGLGGNYLRVAQTIHVGQAIDCYPGPVLIVHGTADETIPVEYGVRAVKRYRDAELALIPGDTHCYDYHLDQVTDAVHAWLLRRGKG